MRWCNIIHWLLNWCYQVPLSCNCQNRVSRPYLKTSFSRLKKVIKQMELGICIIHLCKTYVSCITVLQNEPWIGDGKTLVHFISLLVLVDCAKLSIFLTARANNKLLSSSRIYKKINQNLICLLFKGFFLRVFSFFKIRIQKEFEYKWNIFILIKQQKIVTLREKNGENMWWANHLN